MTFDNGPLRALVQRYDLSGPRYTSYPTVPAWTTDFGESDYQSALNRFSEAPEPLSLYVHIPFCNSRCYYCGCNVVIKRHDPALGTPYLDALAQEITGVTQHLPAKPLVHQFHIGGGTPNYLEDDQTRRLFQMFHDRFEFAETAEISIEVDPRYLTREMLLTLKELGVNRISMGIQDFDPTVQKSVNRVQSVESVTEVMNWSQELQIGSINMDLIYGLPFQTAETMQRTIDQVIQLRPDRIAFYSYAHIPGQISHQKILDAYPMAEGEEKLNLFLNGRSQLIEAGYQAIAMDHFALPTDELAQAFNARKLYRNFMGYTTQPAFQYLGFGVSAIGNIAGTFVQNIKEIAPYIDSVSQGRLPVTRGILLTPDDAIRQWVIGQLMCHFEVDKAVFEHKFILSFDHYFEDEFKHLQPFIDDGLIQNKTATLLVQESGRWFVRNIAMVFDAYLAKQPQQFSRTV